MPFIMILNTAMYAVDNPARVGLVEPLKDIVRGVPRATYNGYRAPLGDFYSPTFAMASRQMVATYSRVITGGFADKPWIVGITIDDADKLFGFKSRSGDVFQPYPHPGFFIATAKFLYSRAEHPRGLEWIDPHLHSKHAWIRFLRGRYANNIATLNSAWNTHGFYTAFDSHGGYGIGTGVIDEDGRHTDWVGRLNARHELSGASSAFRADLDAFLYHFVTQYAVVTVSAIRSVDTNHLIFGPAALNAFGIKARDEVLRGLSDGGIDVFQWHYDPRVGDLSENMASYDLVGKPAFIWYTVTSNADSPRVGSKPWYGAPDFPTQLERGRRYKTDLRKFLHAKSSRGDHFILGIDWWELVDTRKANEAANMGLITRRDNAYDGREAVVRVGTDPWGYRTGGERGDYGNFLGEVVDANSEVLAALIPHWKTPNTGSKNSHAP
jgi:hypothetical protein